MPEPTPIEWSVGEPCVWPVGAKFRTWRTKVGDRLGRITRLDGSYVTGLWIMRTGRVVMQGLVRASALRRPTAVERAEIDRLIPAGKDGSHA